MICGTDVGDGNGGGGNGNPCLLFVGPTALSPSTGGFVYRCHTATVACTKILLSGTYYPFLVTKIRVTVER